MLYEIVHKLWKIIRNVLKETYCNRLNYSSDDDPYTTHLWYSQRMSRSLLQTTMIPVFLEIYITLYRQIKAVRLVYNFCNVK